MLVVVHCTSCGKAGSFSLHLKFTYTTAHCGHCHHLAEQSWTFYFCDTECMFGWMKTNKVEEQGFPCQSCYNATSGEITGFAFGFKSNGVCKICNGAKHVKAEHTNQEPLA